MESSSPTALSRRYPPTPYHRSTAPWDPAYPQACAPNTSAPDSPMNDILARLFRASLPQCPRSLRCIRHHAVTSDPAIPRRPINILPPSRSSRPGPSIRKDPNPAIAWPTPPKPPKRIGHTTIAFRFAVQAHNQHAAPIRPQPPPLRKSSSRRCRSRARPRFCRTLRMERRCNARALPADETPRRQTPGAGAAGSVVQRVRGQTTGTGSALLTGPAATNRGSTP